MSILPSSYCYYHTSSQVHPKALLANSFRLSGVSSGRHTTRRLSSVNLTATPPLRCMSISASLQELDLSEDNVKQVLLDAREKFSHIFDTSVGMTGVAELAEVDGPYVKISLKGRFWHERSLILARLGNYLKQRIPV
ncbi:hypothetical protein AgCh_005871 [Apium graveolens]